MGSIPKCNLTLNGKLIYSSGISKAGNVIGGGLGLIVNSVLAVIFLIIYMVTKSTFVLVLFLLCVASAIYSRYQISSSVPTNTPPRPCKDDKGVILN
jgi:hypothetical protein